MKSTVDLLRLRMREQGIDLAIISDPTSIAYLTNFQSDPHERQFFFFLPLDGSPTLFTPELDRDRAKALVSYNIVSYHDSENPWQKIQSFLSRERYRIGLEFQHLRLRQYYELMQILTGQVVDLSPTIENIRLYKTPAELELLRKAGQMADYALSLGFKAISKGKTELDIIAAIEGPLRSQDVSMSFETMVLADKHAADPHGVPTNRPLKNKSLLLFDLGTWHQGYASDVSRTVALGQPTVLQATIYDIVLEAQLAAMEAIKPGVTAGEIDAVARDIISKAGYGEYFNHRLGHGIGRSLHEYPSLNQGNSLVLEEGMTFSVEPGIYLPNKVGVRIEDCGVVTKTGFEAFTHTPKELLQFKL